MNLVDFALFVPVLLLSIVVHEVAHAWQARREGDTTAADQGRITLNPLAHLDLWGSVLVPIMLWASAGVMLGWARPVPVDSSRFRDHPGSDIRVSLAGIVSNMGLAIAFLVLAFTAVGLAPILPDVVSTGLGLIAAYGLFINLLLAFFNLLPVPPLDGSHVVASILPRRLAAPYRKFGQVGLIAIMVVLVFAPGMFSTILAPVNWVFEFSMGLVQGAM
ncbi:MAG TPA: site-2 protease family protein [Longimicrobiales bacterium]|nr:site-2 protease family protein [Longimicrobiales bacterium]